MNITFLSFILFITLNLVGPSLVTVDQSAPKINVTVSVTPKRCSPINYLTIKWKTYGVPEN
ncbi:429_t:CDS:1, partial [Scutellospora calospora]